MTRPRRDAARSPRACAPATPVASDDELIDRLTRPDAMPSHRATLAIHILEGRPHEEVLRAALDVLADTTPPAARPVLLRTYAGLDSAGVRRDAGGFNRVAIVRAIRRLGQQEDVPILERAASTYEFSLIDRAEIADPLRAAGLIALHDLDHTLAAFYAARLLFDRYTASMSGEPALTAVRVLAAQRNAAVLYAYVMQPKPPHADVTASCLRLLTDLPASLLSHLAAAYRECDDPAIMLGLFDGVLGHRASVTALDSLVYVLDRTSEPDLYRSLLTAMVAAWKEPFAPALSAVVDREVRRWKLAALHDALMVRAGLADIDRLLAAVRGRLIDG